MGWFEPLLIMGRPKILPDEQRLLQTRYFIVMHTLTLTPTLEFVLR